MKTTTNTAEVALQASDKKECETTLQNTPPSYYCEECGQAGPLVRISKNHILYLLGAIFLIIPLFFWARKSRMGCSFCGAKKLTRYERFISKVFSIKTLILVTVGVLTFFMFLSIVFNLLLNLIPSFSSYLT